MTITAQDHGIGQTWSCQSNVELERCVCVRVTQQEKGNFLK